MITEELGKRYKEAGWKISPIFDKCTQNLTMFQIEKLITY